MTATLSVEYVDRFSRPATRYGVDAKRPILERYLERYRQAFEGHRLRPRRPRRPRRISIDRAIAAAEKAGKTVTGVTATPDGVTLTFGANSEANPWDKVLGDAAQPKKRAS